MSTQIHSTAIVHPDAQLGEGVIVGPYAIIEENVIIGARTRIDAHASIKKFVRMGEDNHIYSHACVGGDPQDLKFSGEESWLELGNRNRVREFSTLNRGTEAGGGLTKIGDDNLFTGRTVISNGNARVARDSGFGPVPAAVALPSSKKVPRVFSPASIFSLTVFFMSMSPSLFQ